MKKQLFIAVSVLLAALLLFGLYEFVFKEDDIIDQADEFYTLTEEVAAEIEKIDDDVEIVFSGVNESKVSGDEDLNRAYLFALAYNEINSNISVDFDEKASFSGIVFKKGDKEKQVAFNELYKTFENGTKYAFDGERIYTDAILSLSGKPILENIQLRALEGYDTDGDVVVQKTGFPFMYPNIGREDVLSITVKNQNDTYKAYRAKDNKFYFEGAELISYNPEMFSSLVVNSTYVLSIGKVEDPLELSTYGLDSEENATAVVTVKTLDDVTHKIIIGNKNPSGNFYYAKYYTKDFVYMLKATDLETAVLQPLTSFLTQNLVYGITQQQDLYAVDNIAIDYLDEEFSLKSFVHSKLFSSGNLKVYGETDLIKVLTNKLDFSGSYTNWTETSSLAGFTSSDGKSVYLEVPLANYGTIGDYKVTFGLMRDDANLAYMPKSLKASISLDGKTFSDIDVGDVSFTQGNKELKNYSFNFHSDEPVRAVRIYFGTDMGKYIVLDEITVYVDGKDAQPDDGIVGGWKLTSPEEYIPKGKNYIYPCIEFPADFLASIATLVGDKIVDYAITSDMANPKTLIEEKLAEYGLDKPAKHVSFEFKGVKNDLYFSAKNENGNYYCYSLVSGDSNGKQIDICTDVIAEISAEKAKWLEWDIVDFLDHSLVSMYIDSIDMLTISFGGKDYDFAFEKDDAGKLSRVTIDGKEVDLPNFRYLYVSLLNMYVQDEYKENEGTPTETLKIKISSKSKSPEIVFYRVTTSKAYYTIDGEGKYFVLVEDINTIKKNVGLLLEGKEVPKK